MSLSPKLLLRQSQSLVMTPQLMQAIKLLQLSSLDLQAYIATEIEQNPLLERAEGDAGPAEPETADGPDSPVIETGEARDGDWMETRLPESRADIEERMDTDLGNVFQDEAPMAMGGGETYTASAWSGVGSGGDGEGESSLEAFASSDLGLHDHLEAQLSLATSDTAQRFIGRSIIDCIDDTGYLTEPLSEIAERLAIPLPQAEAVLKMIHAMDPPGVGARSLEECLSIQLRDRNRFDPAMQALVKNLDLLAKRDLQQLKKLCGVDGEDLVDMIAEIRQLTPKPGLAFGGSPVQSVIPDVIVRAAPDGTWFIELNAETLPRVLVNQSYYAKVSRTAKNQGEKAFLAECLQTANWLTRSLEQRARTILKVSSEIVRQQDAFLTHGVHFLRPMNLRAVADAISMHESTVSRVTANKYIATPRGTFEMKYFFTAAIASTGRAEAHSAEAVRHRIKEMIDAEQASDVLSDDAIVQALRDSGVDIARRTVAKYREAMGIASSVQRRREKVTPL
ncbi:RNA polymerase factor sigma-54 [Terrihabitans soli]|nr:RNA polymerase factor sigma-54 [Terrihabitans soli]